MSSSLLHAAIALGSVLIVGAFVAFLPSILPASERSQANRICRDEGISQASELHEICLAQTIRHWNEKTIGAPAASLAWLLTLTRRVCALDCSQRRTVSAPALTTSLTRAI
jgi:hypothetical protein